MLAPMLQFFGNRSFMRHEAQGFPEDVIYNAFDKDEHVCKRTVQQVPLADVLDRANILASHTIYKVKFCDDSSLQLKARIVPHGNERDLHGEHRNDCAMCSPV